MFATHQVGSAVAKVLEKLQGAGEGLFGTPTLLHLGPRNFMRKLIF